MSIQYSQWHQQLPSSHIKKFRTQQQEWPIKNQKELILTLNYVNYIGCPLNTDAPSKSLQLYSTLQGNAPQYLKEKLQQKQFPRLTRKSTSSGITLDTPFNRRKSLADRGFSYAAAKYWNDLPDHIKTAEDINKFKSLLKTHFFRLAFSST